MNVQLAEYIKGEIITYRLHRVYLLKVNGLVSELLFLTEVNIMIMLKGIGL